MTDTVRGITRAHPTVPLVALAALVLVGCDGALSDRSPAERVSAAPGATLSAGTAAYTLTILPPTPTAPGDEDTAGATRTDTVGAARIPPDALTAEGAIDFEAGTSRMEMEVAGGVYTLDAVFDGEHVYVRMPPMTGGEARWFRGSPGQMAGAGTSAGMTDDPTGFVRALRDVESEVESLGSDTVRGVPVEGFEFELDGAALWRGPEGEAPASISELRVPGEVWLDGENRVRRVTLRIEMEAFAAALREALAADSLGLGAAEVPDLEDVEGTATVTMELFDFGAEVEITPPDSAEVVDFDEMRGRSGGGPGGAR